MSNHPFKDDEPDHPFSWLDVTVIVLSGYVLIALLFEATFRISEETRRLIFLVDDLICIVFLYDFVVRFRRAPSKLEFMKWGWIDLIASIPTAHLLHAGRAVHLLRLLRLLRAFRSMRHLFRHLYHSPARGTFASVVLSAIILIIFSSIAILQVETLPHSNIRTAEDALWWSYVTITTVGYGDYFPVTTSGRVIALVLMTAGVGLFGTFTAYVASWFAQSNVEVSVKMRPNTSSLQMKEETPVIEVEEEKK